MDTVPVVEFHPRGGLPNFAGNVKLAGCGRSRYPVSAHFLGQVRTPVTSPTSVWYFTGCRIRLLGKPVRPAGEKERAGDGMGVWVGPAGPAGLRVQRCDGSELPWEVGRAIGMSHVGLVDSAEGRLPMVAGRSTTPQLAARCRRESRSPGISKSTLDPQPFLLRGQPPVDAAAFRHSARQIRPLAATGHAWSVTGRTAHPKRGEKSVWMPRMGTGLSVFRNAAAAQGFGPTSRGAWLPAMPATAGDRQPTASGLRPA